jgi:hypothetical protein
MHTQYFLKGKSKSGQSAISIYIHTSHHTQTRARPHVRTQYFLKGKAKSGQSAFWLHRLQPQPF